MVPSCECLQLGNRQFPSVGANAVGFFTDCCNSSCFALKKKCSVQTRDVDVIVLWILNAVEYGQKTIFMNAKIPLTLLILFYTLLPSSQRPTYRSVIYWTYLGQQIFKSIASSWRIPLSQNNKTKTTRVHNYSWTLTGTAVTMLITLHRWQLLNVLEYNNSWHKQQRWTLH